MSKSAHKLLTLLLNLGINVLLLLVVDALFDRIKFGSARDFIAAAVLLMLANVYLKPMLIVLTLPITILTLGLFTIVINAVLLQLISWLLPGFTITSFWAAIWAALVMGICNFLLNWFLNPRQVRVQVYRH
jgi:putative membrane protein